jgi:ABC-2 type transport system ATP-binding protein
MASDNVIVLKNLTKDYGEGRGTFGLTFDVPRGSVFGYCGPNGAGKTTTIRQMMGFLKPDEGSATLFGYDSWKDAQTIKQYVGYIPGEIAFPDVATGTDFLRIQANMIGLTDMSRAEYVIKKMQLDPTAKLKSMSKGMKQKTAIVSAFMAQADLLILDEPTTGLDPLMRDAFLSLVLEEKAKGKTIFMSSHIFSEMEQTCDYVAFIKEGHLAQIVDVGELHHPTKASYRVRFSLKGDYEAFAQEKLFPLKDEDPKLLSLTVEVPLEKTQSLFQSLGRYHVVAFNEIKATLEACFDDIIAGGK